MGLLSSFSRTGSPMCICTYSAMDEPVLNLTTKETEQTHMALGFHAIDRFHPDKHALSLISGHYQTGEPLPEDLFDKMLAAKNFQSGMMMARQLEFSLFDFRIHRDFDPDKNGRIYETLDKVRSQVAVMPAAKFNRFAHSFAHIFAGGYAAGYYSYKWAEVLSCDAFSLFEENGIFDAETGQSFLENILEKGGSEDAMSLFVKFRGRKPTIDALLRHNGIEE